MNLEICKRYRFLSNKYSQKLLDSAMKSTKDAVKTASKRAIQKTAEETADLIGNNIADKITSTSKELHSKQSLKNALKTDENELNIPKEKYIPPKRRQQIIDELRLI